jgi:hypothetical protein
LRPGEYTITPLAAGSVGSRYVARSATLTVGPKDAEVLLELERAASVSGVVVVENSGSPKALAALRAMYIQPGSTTERSLPADAQIVLAEIGPDNRFRLVGLPAGDTRLAFTINTSFAIRSVELQGRSIRDGFRLAAGEQVDGVKIVVAYGTGVIRGRIELRNGSLSLGAEMHVEVTRVGPRAVDDPTPVSGAVTAGEFLVEGLQAGEYDVIASVPEEDDWSSRGQTPVRVKVEEGQTVEIVLVADLSRSNE